MLGVQSSFADTNPEYKKFVDKFKPKKTTDDCYTPEAVYDAVCDWVAAEYEVEPHNFVRPFWPGGDYERFDYAPESIVVDNPPFSLMSEIIRFYLYRKVRFFIFAPTLTIFGSQGEKPCTAVVAGAQITYENGAKIPTSFITNLETEPIVARTAPELKKAVEKANEDQTRGKSLPTYRYPQELLMASDLTFMSKWGVDYRVSRGEALRVSQLDSQKPHGKGVFGSGLLLAEKAAAEKAAAEKAAAEKEAAEEAAAEDYIWELSDREKLALEYLSAKTKEESK